MRRTSAKTSAVAHAGWLARFRSRKSERALRLAALCVHASVAPVCVLVDRHCYGRAFGAAKWPPSTDGHCAGGAPFASPITTWPPRPTPTATGARVRAAIGIKDKHLHIITRIFSGA